MFANGAGAAGSWQYSSDSGVNWITIPNVSSNSSAFVVAANDLLRFLPAPNFWGGPDTNTYVRLIDSSAGQLVSGTTVDLSAPGGISPFSDQILLRPSVRPLNDAPTLIATASDPIFSEGVDPGVQGAAVSVFSGASVSIGPANETDQSQRVLGFTFTVAGLVDGANEALVVDGTSIMLGANSVGTTSINGIAYTVSITGGVAEVALNKASGMTPSTVSAVVNGLTYQNADIDNPTPGSRTFTLTRI